MEAAFPHDRHTRPSLPPPHLKFLPNREASRHHFTPSTLTDRQSAHGRPKRKMASTFTPDHEDEEAHRLFLARNPSFVLRGARENVDAARAAALVAESLDQLRLDLAKAADAAAVIETKDEENEGNGGKKGGCKRVQLSNKSLSEEAAKVVADALRNLGEEIEHADISDIIAGKHEDEALRVLEIGKFTRNGGKEGSK